MTLQNSWLEYSRNTWASNVESLERCLFVPESNEARVDVDNPLICAKPATQEKFWMRITELVVFKRGEALNPRVRHTERERARDTLREREKETHRERKRHTER